MMMPTILTVVQSRTRTVVMKWYRSKKVRLVFYLPPSVKEEEPSDPMDMDEVRFKVVTLDLWTVPPDVDPKKLSEVKPFVTSPNVSNHSGCEEKEGSKNWKARLSCLPVFSSFFLRVITLQNLLIASCM